jgi:predicted nucleic acid-binding Zn ribbon protein
VASKGAAQGGSEIGHPEETKMAFTPSRRRPPPRDPTRVDGSRIARVLSELGYDANAPAARLLRAWEGVVPPDLAPHCEPTDWKQDTLELSVASPVWAQQIALRKGEILAALKTALGPAAPTDLRTRVR